MQSIFTTLAGIWFIYYTNFPMWIKGDKVLLDEVKYLKMATKKTLQAAIIQTKNN